MKEVILPSYSIGEDSFEAIGKISRLYGNKIVLIYGEKAFEACRDKLNSYIRKYDCKIIKSYLYGKDATYENVDKIINDGEINNANMIFAIGGGKCIDTCKVIGDKCNIPVVTVPTIASTCAAITKISIMYTEDHVFKDIYHCRKAPNYCMIDTEVIMNAPLQYLWAGIGDTVAKNVETYFSCRNDEIEYTDELALQVSNLCYDSIIAHGTKGYHDAKAKILSKELEITIQNILVSTGIVSLIINADYNSALAHALFYGLTCRKEIEEKHFHGEVVSYGVLIQLIVDKQIDKLNKTIEFYKTIGLPICLNDLDISKDDPLEDVLELTIQNKELNHIPYPITKAMIRDAIDYLEV